MSMYIPREHYPNIVEQVLFFRRLVARLEAVPGVQSVALASVPPTEAAAHAPYEIANASPLEEGSQSTVAQMTVSPGYFRTLEASIVSGREFSELDGPSSTLVGIVNQSFVRRHSHMEPVLGKRLRLFQDGIPQAWYTIVGIASDIVQDDRTRQNAEPLVMSRTSRDRNRTCSSSRALVSIQRLSLQNSRRKFTRWTPTCPSLL